RARPGHSHIQCAQAVIAGEAGGGGSRLLSREGRALARPAEPQRSGAFPAQRVAHLVGDGDDGVVERGLNVRNSVGHILALALLELLVFGGLAGLGFGFCHYVFAVAFFLPAIVPLRGPLRVRALVWVRCPRTGSERRWRRPR